MIGGELLQIAIEYRPSLQTQHLGLFGSMTVVALLLGYWIYRTRRTRGAHLFAATLFLLGLRTGSDVIHGLVGELWAFQAFLVAVNPLIELCTLVVFVRFAGRYAGMQRFTGKRATWAMVGLVVVVTAAIATNPVHELVFTSFHRISIPFTYVGGQRGILGFGLVAVNGVLLLTAAGSLAHTFTTGMRPAWWPAAVLSMAVSQAVLVGGLQLGAGGVLPQYDYGAIGLGGFVLLTTLGLVDHGLRRIEVIAREEVLDEIDDAVVFLDGRGSIVDYNTAATRLFEGIDVGEPFTERFEEPERIPLEAGPGRVQMTIEASGPDPERAVNGSDDREGGPGQETSQRTGPRHFLVHTSGVVAETRELLGYTVRFVDVTELEQRSRELQRKNEQLDQFASTVSHDLRNPLTVASGYLEMVFQSVDAPDGTVALDVEQVRTYLDKVEVSLDRMTAIIEDILALIENTDPVTETQPVDFGAVTTAAWEAVDTGTATLNVDAGGHVEADTDRLQRLLENLFRNAIDHVGEDVTIEAGLTESTFYVADDGPGIPDADHDRIFEHGYTTGGDGTGLGLSIVQQLVSAHGWSIAVDPDYDGARFVVSGCEATTGAAAVPTKE